MDFSVEFVPNGEYVRCFVKRHSGKLVRGQALRSTSQRQAGPRSAASRPVTSRSCVNFFRSCVDPDRVGRSVYGVNASPSDVAVSRKFDLGPTFRKKPGGFNGLGSRVLQVLGDTDLRCADFVARDKFHLIGILPS